MVLCTGIFMVAVGRPTDQTTGREASWWKVATFAVVFGSFALGFAVAQGWVSIGVL